MSSDYQSMSEALSGQIEALAAALAPLNSLVVITGAGVSAESGIATFRGKDGYWNRFRAEELASPAGFARDPALVWRWYDERRRALLSAVPNPGHHAIAALEQLFPAFSLITQNVDGLHQQAGSSNVLEIHGSIWVLRCTRTGQAWTSREAHDEFPLRCACGALLRPGVLWFGESYEPKLIHKAQSAVARAEAVLVVGTSGQVWIVAGLLNEAQGALVAEFNLEATETGQDADYLLLSPSGQTLPKLVEAIRRQRSHSKV